MTLEVDISHDFGAFRLDVRFDAPAGVTALFGRSGAGKTTIVNAISGLLRPDRARIAVDGTVLTDTEAGIRLAVHRRRIGYVFQDARLFPHLTVRQNLAFGGWFAPRGAPRATPAHVIELLGIGALLGRRPRDLSGGERQRVAIGRALLAAPRLLLMDEPLASLDEARKDEIIPYLERLRDETEVPILYVSHAVAEIARLATTVVAVGGGRVLASGPAGEMLADPGRIRLFGVREAGAVLHARVVAHDDADGLTELALSAGRIYLPRLEASPGTMVRVRVGAHDVILTREKPAAVSTLNVLAAVVTSVSEGEGPGAAVGLLAGEDRLLARLTRRSVRALGLTPGEPVWAMIKATSVAPRDVGTGD